jgi:hypothetical protein
MELLPRALPVGLHYIAPASFRKELFDECLRVAELRKGSKRRILAIT